MKQNNRENELAINALAESYQQQQLKNEAEYMH